MKTSPILLVITGLAAGCTLLAAAPATGDPTNSPSANAVPALAATNALAAPDAATTNAPTAEGVTTNGLPKLSAETNATEGLRFNFRGAPLNLVLEHLVKAAGFIIAKESSDVRGTVEIWSQGLVTKEEAIELVGSALRKNGYGFSLHDRIITISSLDGINHTDLPLHFGKKWEDIPRRTRSSSGFCQSSMPTRPN